MHMIWIPLSLWLLSFGVFSESLALNSSIPAAYVNVIAHTGSNQSSTLHVGVQEKRPAQVTIGAILTFKSTIGRVAKVAIEEAVKDVNSNSSVLHGTKLVVNLQDSNCNGFLGTVEALQFVKNDTIAIIGPQSSVVAHTLSYVANNLHVPLLSFTATDPTLSSLQYPYFVRTTYSDLHQMTAIADIVNYYGWTEVISIFIDDDYGRNGVASLDDALAAKDCKISYKAGIPLTAADTNQNDIMDILVKVMGMESKVIVLHAYPDVGFLVFSVAQSLEMMGDGYVWIATDWLSSAIDSSPTVLSEKMESMQGIIVLRQHTVDSDKKKAFTSKMKRLIGESSQLNPYALFAYDTVWLVAHAMNKFFEQGGVISFSNASKLSPDEGSSVHIEAMTIFDGGELLLSNILQSSFIGLTGPVKFDSSRSLSNPAYDIMNVLGIGFRRIGYWSSYSGLSTESPDVLYSRPPNNNSRANQKLYSVIWPGGTTIKPRGWVYPNNGKQLRIGVPRRVIYREFVSHVPGTNIFKGLCIDIFMSSVNLLPYAVPYTFVPFGDGISNPGYTDLINMIAAGDLDGAVGDLAITTNRSQMVAFTQPYTSSGLVVVAPFQKLNTDTWAFLSPFTAKMGLVTCVFVIFIGISMWVLEHRINDEFRGTPKKQAVTILWFSISSFYFTHREDVLGTLGRAVMLTWLFLVLVITSNYTASLTTFLTVQQLHFPMDGIASLKDGNERIGYQAGSFAETYLTQQIGIAKSRLVPLGSPEDYATELLRGPKKGGVAAVVDERPYIDLFLSSHCQFEIVGQEFTKSGWGFAFPHDSPLAEDLSTAILRLSENGDLQRIHDKWLTFEACSTEHEKIYSDILHLRSYVGLFLVCGIAAALCILAYYFNIYFNKCREGQAAKPEAAVQGLGNSSSKRLRRFISEPDGKEDGNNNKYSGENKRRRIGKSLSNNILNGVTIVPEHKRAKSENVPRNYPN